MTTAPTADRPVAPPGVRPAVVTLEEVVKTYGSLNALDGINLEIPEGEIFGLIGPSGCGKTTVARMLVGLSAPTDGRVFVRGTEPRNFGPPERQAIGYTPQGFVLYPTLSVEQNARFVASLYGLGYFKRRRRVREVLQFLELWDARKRLARDISGGMQRRLSLACALLHSPRLLVVDEPTAGLDPILRAKIWEHLEYLRDTGATVIVTTQYVDEASHCQRVALLREGRVVAVGAPDELRVEAIGGEHLHVEADVLRRDDIAALWGLECVKRVEWQGGPEARLLVEDVATASPVITQLLTDRGVHLEAVRPHIASFDEIFVALLAKS